MVPSRTEHGIPVHTLSHNGIHLVPSTSLQLVRPGHPSADRSNLLYRAAALAAALFLVITMF